MESKKALSTAFASLHANKGKIPQCSKNRKGRTRWGERRFRCGFPCSYFLSLSLSCPQVGGEGTKKNYHSQTRRRSVSRQSTSWCLRLTSSCERSERRKRKRKNTRTSLFPVLCPGKGDLWTIDCDRPRMWRGRVCGCTLKPPPPSTDSVPSEDCSRGMFWFRPAAKRQLETEKGLSVCGVLPGGGERECGEERRRAPAIALCRLSLPL